MSKERIQELQAKVATRQNRDGFKRNVEVIRAEIRRLGGNA